MIKIVTIIGARPQIIKAAALSRAIKNKFSQSIKEVIVHTGQHYDNNMSQVFFDELQIPSPDYNLNVGSASHGKQTALMIQGIEEILVNEKPNYLVLYGDTNSTLAGGIAASKIHIPVVHIEAGLRSFNKSMPEEINRILCDHVSTLLFSPTKTGYDNLVNEGFKTQNLPPFHADNPKIYHCGDIMYDNSLYFSAVAESKSNILQELKLKDKKYILSTIHRDNNTDNPERLEAIFKAMHDISINNSIDFVVPLHPRTSKLLQSNLSVSTFENICNNKYIHLLPPVSFIDMIALESKAFLVMTDSGGVQKEAFFFQKPCIILRPETEWVEIVKSGSCILADANYIRIIEAYKSLTSTGKQLQFPQVFGDGKSAEFMCEEMIKNAN